MNHVTHLDWLYFWSVVGRHGDLLTWKVVTKNNIRHLPLLGVCVCVHVCVSECVCECVCAYDHPTRSTVLLPPTN